MPSVGINRPECRFDSLSDTGSSHEPSMSNRRAAFPAGNHTPTCGAHIHDSPAATCHRRAVPRGVYSEEAEEEDI